jgi:hypothetical protein
VKLNRLNLIIGVAAFALVTVMPASVAAQARPNPRTGPPGLPPDSVREMRERDMNIRRLEIERDRNAKPALEVSKETVKQVNEDFARIQGINAEMMRDYVSGSEPNYKHISEAMAEIKKRAARLNANLLLPEGDAVANDSAIPSGLQKGTARSPLLDLNDLICGFVTNPIFKSVNTIDLTLGAKARRDLANIIDLSGRISKSAEKLSKGAAKSN